MKEPLPREALLARLDETLARFLAACQNPASAAAPVYPGWTVKDVLGHITFWHESFARNVAALAQGARPRPLKGRLSDLNPQGVADMRPLTLAEVVARLQAAHAIIQAHILDPRLVWIPYKRGSRDYTPAEHLDIVTKHIGSHLKDIQAACRGG